MVENDAEKTTMSFKDYKGRQATKEKELGRELNNSERDQITKLIADAGDLKRCLQSKLVLSYWASLESVLDGKHFHNTKYFASKWVDKTIHSPGGGVS